MWNVIGSFLRSLGLTGQSSSLQFNSDAERQTIVNSAIAICQVIEKVLDEKWGEEHIDYIKDFTATIPDMVYREVKILSYAMGDTRKFLGDADIRETDSEYDEWFRDKLRSYIDDIREIISERS